MGIFNRNTNNAEGDTSGQTSEDNSQQSEPQTKMDRARVVFTKMFGQEGVKRKDIIARFISDCDLTKAGASTYYAKLKKVAENGNNKGDAGRKSAG